MPALKLPWFAFVFSAGLAIMGQAAGQSVLRAASGEVPMLVEFEGSVEVSRAGSPLWDPARVNQPLLPGDRVRTGDRSRAVVRLSDKTVLRKGPQTIIEIPEAKRSGIRLLKGILYYFHRDKPRDFPVITPACYAAVVGTEFSVMVAENGTTTLHLLDGQVDLTNQVGQVRLKSGETAVAEPNSEPRRTAAIEAINAVQWCLYYPGVLDADDLEWTDAERQALSKSLTAYRDGDLLQALASYPAGRRPALDSEKVYLAALVLAVGQVEQADRLLGSLAPALGSDSRVTRLAMAARTVIAAVKLQPDASALTSEASTRLATEWLAESYFQQSRSSLDEALLAARHAVRASTNFAFAWVRVAELEFSFGRIGPAKAALDRGLALAPRNAQAHALAGFLLSAQNRIQPALSSFEQAIAFDGALGNAWLGRGLCRIRQGDPEAGLQDLQVAATLEPQRAALRSYLGKAFSNVGDLARADKELDLAKKLDAGDPTAWLYSALLNQQRNRINEAVRDLEHSQELNDNRSVYRSRLLLDQDRAVRGANLATIYRDAGMTEVSVREASRAVNADYANFSAHLFLAESFDALRDPRQVNLRYETPWLSEFLLANLLAPAGAGTLSPYVTQQEYSRLFEQDRFGLVSSTEYLSRGAWEQVASQFGSWRNTSYALDAGYRSDNGEQVNGDYRQLFLSLSLKHQFTPHDSVYLQAGYYDAEAGDVNQYYDPRQAIRGLRLKENQEPLLVAGYHHAWAPGSHTLLLAGRAQDTFRVNNPQQESLILAPNPVPTNFAALPFSMEQRYRSELEIYTAEAQQILQKEGGALILGGRYQTGHFDTQNRHANAAVEGIHPVLASILESQLDALPSDDVDPSFERVAAYSYLHLRPLEPLLLIGGVTYDHLRYPVNYRYAPLSSDENTKSRVSPKAGIIWTPWKRTTVRGAYARALGGVSLDQSFQLEPAQVAGFVQTYRSLIPESVEGANAVPLFETWAVSLEQTFPSGTYLGVTGELLESKVDRVVGAYEFIPPDLTPVSTRKALDFRERNLLVTLNQLVGAEWSLGARYRLSVAELDGRFVEVPVGARLLNGFQSRTRERGVLHQAQPFVRYHHPCGFFAQADALWTRQDTDGFPPGVADEDLWQFNAFAGYRMLQRRVEMTLGVLNLTGQDYRLHPLNLIAELPRERTFVARLRFYF